jgi:serine/threonine protein kinase
MCAGEGTLDTMDDRVNTTMHSRDSDPNRGKIIAGRYTIVRTLGRGGMGKVLLVDDQLTGERVALKMLRAMHLANDQVVARFLREIDAVRRLDHPCIVKIYDAKHTDTELYYTMEYVRGISLRQWRQQKGNLAFASVTRVLCLVADGLEHAHKVTVHRDISPENIMVMKDGTVRLLDFGLAKLEDNNPNLTRIGVGMGKVMYLPPEQRYNAAKVDHRADIFPLGVILYELLTGKLPKPEAPLSLLRPDLPRELDAFLAKATAEAPSARYQTAREFRIALLEIYRLHEAREQAAAEREQKRANSWRGRLQAWWKKRFGRTAPATLSEEG